MPNITVTVDGVTYSDEVEPRLLLVHYLRDRLGLEARSDAVQRFSWNGVLSRITEALPPARRLATK